MGIDNLWFSKRRTKGAVVVGVVLVGFWYWLEGSIVGYLGDTNNSHTPL